MDYASLILLEDFILLDVFILLILIAMVHYGGGLLLASMFHCLVLGHFWSAVELYYCVVFE